jgi:hypothetical protein
MASTVQAQLWSELRGVAGKDAIAEQAHWTRALRSAESSWLGTTPLSQALQVGNDVAAGATKRPLKLAYNVSTLSAPSPGATKRNSYVTKQLLPALDSFLARVVRVRAGPGMHCDLCN